MRDVLRSLEQSLCDGRPCVYCVLVETRGSTPQKAGASMLVYADGGQAGTLGGGCVEAEVKQRALRSLNTANPQAELMSFHLDDNYGWDDGLICGGRMSILAQPMPAPASPAVRSYFTQLADVTNAGTGCIEAVSVDPACGHAIGSRFLFSPAGTQATLSADARPGPQVLAHLPDLKQRPKPSLTRGVAYLPVLERITLFIVGGGHVGQAVADLASRVDFDIWVLDDREKYANAERFPMAQQRFVGEIGPTLKTLAAEHRITPSMYCLIVTRGHAHDEEALFHLARTNAGYVGMIGSKRKIKLIFEDLMAQGIDETTLARVHAPLGLPIGSQTVSEIAVSIVAELIACRNLAGAT